MCNGYMSPEYAMHGQFSVKSDVFSFGVLVLEIISGRKNSSFQNGENIENLLSYVSIFILGLMAHTPNKYRVVGQTACSNTTMWWGEGEVEGIKWLNGSGKNMKQYPFIFRMWSIKYSTCWPVPISKALILSIKLQIIDVACIASWLYTKYIGI